jgi:chemotaxis response regulator CheB
MIRVLVVDDYLDFRQAFVAMLEGQPDLEVVSQAGSLAEARTMLEKAWTLLCWTARCPTETAYSS